VKGIWIAHKYKQSEIYIVIVSHVVEIKLKSCVETLDGMTACSFVLTIRDKGTEPILPRFTVPK